MNIEVEKIRSYRLHAHHLDRKIPMHEIISAAGVCGLQDSPPGAWQTALFNRLEGCTTEVLDNALYKEKILLEAWSYRGAPVVFPTAQSGIFLTALIAQEQEQPWIYTMGISGALDLIQMPFDDLLMRVKEAAMCLDGMTVKSKEVLDSTLADIIESGLPKEKRVLWRAPSMYGNPEKQTVGGAAVSFLLRPCAFSSLVVFGERQGVSPTFTSFKNWTGREPESIADAGKELVRKFLHCYGPDTVSSFMNWLGCSRQQADRLWNTIVGEMEPVKVDGKTCYMLSEDMECLKNSGQSGERMILLGAHDPYLDMRNKTVILENKLLQREVWKLVGNPGVILKGGRIIGTWRVKTLKDNLDVSMTVWEGIKMAEQNQLKELAEEYAVFRGIHLRKCVVAYG